MEHVPNYSERGDKMKLDYNVFVDDYESFVGETPSHVLTQFVNRMKDDMEGKVNHDSLYDQFGEYSGSIMDAVRMWEAGAAHARKLLEEVTA
jgi:hypothetical protein